MLISVKNAGTAECSTIDCPGAEQIGQLFIHPRIMGNGGFGKLWTVTTLCGAALGEGIYRNKTAARRVAKELNKLMVCPKGETADEIFGANSRTAFDTARQYWK
jgi:hypothetical protein